MTTLSNAAIADRIAALDWSGTSLQHQLAVTAAVETLRKQDVPAISVISSPRIEDGDRLTIQTFDGNVIERVARVLPFPAPSAELLRNSACTERRVTLCNLADGSPVASAILARAERWNWIVETTCDLLQCSADAVGCVDNTVTVDGLPVFNC